MLKSSYYILLLLMYCTSTSGQNNYIFNGGEANGFDHATARTESNNGIFSGSDNDGFDKENYSKLTMKWNGGEEDGFGSNLFFQNFSSIFNGSDGDGMDLSTFSQNSNSQFYDGGPDDGFSSAPLTNFGSNLVYNGGEGDGFGASGISKLIWDGDIGKDWLMADNWNIPMVPTMNHTACIPGGLTNYPKLLDILGISIHEDHTYACSDLIMMAGAQITGFQNVKIIVNGKLEVAGDLIIYPNNVLSGIEGRADGMIKILTGGSVRIE